jgi:hypothetical protein
MIGDYVRKDNLEQQQKQLMNEEQILNGKK